MNYINLIFVLVLLILFLILMGLLIQDVNKRKAKKLNRDSVLLMNILKAFNYRSISIRLNPIFKLRDFKYFFSLRPEIIENLVDFYRSKLKSNFLFNKIYFPYCALSHINKTQCKDCLFRTRCVPEDIEKLFNEPKQELEKRITKLLYPDFINILED